ncbi:MAG: OpgC domain-containing protein, partial [Pseudomonadota bacterium]
LQSTGLGEEGRNYTEWYPIAALFTRPGEYLLGISTLTMVPGLFDILPMYLVILALVPAVMAVHKAGGRMASFAFCLVLWFAAQLAGFGRLGDRIEDPDMLQSLALSVGGQLSFLNLPASPFDERAQWFFNPFAWQLVFFTGFAFGTGWLPAPPVSRTLQGICAVYVLAVLPFAWFKIHGEVYLSDGALQDWIANTRDWMNPLRWKTGVGFFRFLHFLALAYLAWSLVGEGGWRLREGWTSPKRPEAARKRYALIALPVVILTAPYGYTAEVEALVPALNRGLESIGLMPPERQIGIVQLIHLAALVCFLWNAIGDRSRQWVLRDAFLATVPVIRKVGTQSLAVFVVSVVLSRFNGWWLDVIGRDVWTRALVNLTGFAVLIAVAYGVGWFRKQPWRETRAPRPQAAQAEAALDRPLRA